MYSCSTRISRLNDRRDIIDRFYNLILTSRKSARTTRMKMGTVRLAESKLRSKRPFTSASEVDIFVRIPVQVGIVRQSLQSIGGMPVHTRTTRHHGHVHVLALADRHHERRQAVIAAIQNPRPKMRDRSWSTRQRTLIPFEKPGRTKMVMRGMSICLTWKIPRSRSRYRRRARAGRRERTCRSIPSTCLTPRCG